jgi:ribose 5-phosphate isomerase A
MPADVIQLKRAAAESAVAAVRDGMVVGLGSGSTAALAVSALGRRVRDGLRVVGIPTSEQTGVLAREAGIPVSTLDENNDIDLTIDGADEVELGSLNLTKGLGGALLREKIVASASRRLVIVVDEAKLVQCLGTRTAIPVEVVPFGWRVTAGRLEGLGAKAVLRLGSNGAVFETDGGHYILDCSFGPIATVERLAERLDRVVGVVEHGLFLGLTAEVHVAGSAGVRVLAR